MDYIEKLKGKIDFIYEVNGGLYIIGKNRVLKFHTEKYPGTDFIKKFQEYKEFVNKIKSNIDFNKDELSDLVYKLNSVSRMEIDMQEDVDKITTLKDFLNNVAEEIKTQLAEQVNDLEEVFNCSRVCNKYPGICY